MPGPDQSTFVSMSAEGLRDYENWIGKSPLEIRENVSSFGGGWSEVFPRGTPIPRWLHRVRNFFNETPTSLLRLSNHDAKAARAKMIKLRSSGFWDSVVDFGALTWDVYKERNGRFWFEMSQAGSEAHSEEHYDPVQSAGRPKSMTGVFKLISPDNTGGSSEVALHNWKKGLTGKFGKAHAAEVGRFVNTETQTRLEEIYRGSYNFGDTTIAGYSEHKRFDMDTDEKYGLEYLNEHRDTPIGERVFARIPEIDGAAKRDPKMAGLPLSYKKQQAVAALCRQGKSDKWIATYLHLRVEDVAKITELVDGDRGKTFVRNLEDR